MTQWHPVPGKPDYETDTHYARYLRTERGQGLYVVHAKAIPPKARKLANAYSVGGLPRRI